MNVNAEYKNTVDTIKNYLIENNLGHYEDKNKEELFNKFAEKYSIEYLKGLYGKDILYKIFMDNKSTISLCYFLEYSKDYDYIAGGIKGGSITKYPLYVSSETGQWTTGMKSYSKTLSEEEAINMATQIRDAIVKGAEYINLIKTELNTIEDYINLGKELDKIFDNCIAKSTYAWIHKYYVLLFPDLFPRIHSEKMKRDMLKKFEIKPLTEYYAKDGQLTLLSKEADLKLYSLFDENIIGLFYKWDKDIWEDFNPDNLISNGGGDKAIKNSDFKGNMIYFGAPGTGKSYVLNQDKEDLLSNSDNYTRVTFHPDYSYANFVGVYKPVPSVNEKGKEIISYKYVPGPFIKVLVEALKHPSDEYLLIIEEINRANVAAVFGDVFQLLDRKKDNSSRYPIDTSVDMKKYLETELKDTFDKLRIPSNMYIWATMNSADQGVFPMDTAFKRRWNFKYFDIDNSKEEMDNVKFTFNNVEISWNKLRMEINKKLLTKEYNINEDKLLGPFFAFDEYRNTEITEDDYEDIVDIFKNKVIMYLFEDAARSKRNDLFSGIPSEGNLTFSQVCKAFDKLGVEIFCDDIKNKFIDVDGE